MNSTMGNTQYKMLQVLNLVSIIAVLIVNFLANYLPLNGLDTGYISDLYPNLFTPAGFTFSIWGLIYLMLIIFAIYQSQGLLQRKGKQLGYVRRIGYLFLASSVFNIAWIFAWHYLQVGLSLFIMIMLFLSLIALYMRLRAGGNEGTGETIAKLAFSIYLGWITIATVANVTIFLVDRGWDQFGLSETFWMVTITLVATAIVLTFMFKNRDWVYALVGVWAFFGILSQRLGTEPVETLVIIIVALCMAILLVGILIMARDNKHKHKCILP